MAERVNWRTKTSVDLLTFLSLRKKKQVAMGLRRMGDKSETERGPETSYTVSTRGSYLALEIGVPDESYRRPRGSLLL